ncbi:MAG: hypothetical protein ACLFSF_08610 [Desulfonatronovibrio sp.]
MGKIIRLPAHNCRFYRNGHCVYHETLNPGLDSSMQCLVLTEMENKFDHLLTQADTFGLSGEQVDKIWTGRFGEIVSWSMFCDMYHPQSEEDDRCLFLFGNACIMRLHLCEGICPSYVVLPLKKDIES